MKEVESEVNATNSSETDEIVNSTDDEVTTEPIEKSESPIHVRIVYLTNYHYFPSRFVIVKVVLVALGDY